MSIINFKSHSLSVLSFNQGYEDENGDFHEGTTFWGEKELCNAVPNGKASERRFEDGVIRTYSFVCYLDPFCREYQEGEKVKLEREGITYECNVKGFMRYQHSAKLWLE